MADHARRRASNGSTDRAPAGKSKLLDRLLFRLPTVSPGVRRAITLSTAILVSLSAGTNCESLVLCSVKAKPQLTPRTSADVFSAYSPQLADRLHLSSTQTNGVAIAGNAGMYLTGPFVGKWVDAKGPRLPLFVSSLLLLSGYGIVYRTFTSSPASSSAPTDSQSPLAWLIIGMFFTGSGSSGALSASANGVAKSFPEHHRGKALAAVISGFGASAFIWATLAHTLFPDNTADFLLLLSLGTAACVMVGVFGVKPVPPEGSAGHKEEGRGYSRLPVDSTESVGLPPPGRLEQEPNPWAADRLNLKQSTDEPHARGSVVVGDRVTIGDSVVIDGDDDDGRPELDIHGWQLWKTQDMWLLLVIQGCCSGAGLMLINNLGTIVHTLYSSRQVASSPPPLLIRLVARGATPGGATSVAKLQASAVSLLSIFNCLGRLCAGVSSDFLRNRYSLDRSWLLAFVALLFLITQLVALTEVNAADQVWRLVVVGGFAYGSLFGTAPVLVLDWFGSAHFSTSFGYLNLAPIVAGQAFNLAFGTIYDRNLPSSGPDGGHAHMCLKGKECYETAFEATLGGSVVALVLAIYVAWRRSRLADPRDVVSSSHDRRPKSRRLLSTSSVGSDPRGRSSGEAYRDDRRRSFSAFAAEAGLSPFADEHPHRGANEGRAG